MENMIIFLLYSQKRKTLFFYLLVCWKITSLWNCVCYWVDVQYVLVRPINVFFFLPKCIQFSSRMSIYECAFSIFFCVYIGIMPRDFLFGIKNVNFQIFKHYFFCSEFSSFSILFHFLLFNRRKMSLKKSMNQTCIQFTLMAPNTTKKGNRKNILQDLFPFTQ